MAELQATRAATLIFLQILAKPGFEKTQVLSSHTKSLAVYLAILL
jgi:hypothetical protein